MSEFGRRRGLRDITRETLNRSNQLSHHSSKGEKRKWTGTVGEHAEYFEQLAEPILFVRPPKRHHPEVVHSTPCPISVDEVKDEKEEDRMLVDATAEQISSDEELCEEPLARNSPEDLALTAVPPTSPGPTPVPPEERQGQHLMTTPVKESIPLCLSPSSPIAHHHSSPLATAPGSQPSRSLRPALRQATFPSMVMTSVVTPPSITSSYSAVTLLVFLTAVLLSTLVWAAWSAIHVPATSFCDSEGMHAMTWHLDCEACPNKGYCAFGQLRACEPPLVRDQEYCSNDLRTSSSTAEIIRLVEATLRTEHCSTSRVRGLTFHQLKTMIQTILPALSNKYFEEIWAASMDRLQLHPSVYGLAPATVAGEPGLEWMGKTTVDRVQCLWQRHRSHIGWTALGITALALTVKLGANRLLHQQQL